MRTLTRAALALLLLATLPACDSNDDDDDAPQPVFSVSSRNVELESGADGITFTARPDIDVTLRRVDIENPEGTSDTFNAQNTVVLGDEPIALQPAGQAYFRVSGDWEFVFQGVTAENEPFSVTVIVTVSA